MRIGVPKEIKVHEYRVGLTPEGARALVAAGKFSDAAERGSLSQTSTREAYIEQFLIAMRYLAGSAPCDGFHIKQRQ